VWTSTEDVFIMGTAIRRVYTLDRSNARVLSPRTAVARAGTNHGCSQGIGTN
jgi:hypothetical protein